MERNATFLLLLFSVVLGFGQEKQSGPIIQDFGKVSAIPNPDFQTDVNATYKVVFDILNSPEDPAVLNTSIETAARFLNMHAQHGVPKENMKVALVVHNKASKDIITNVAYQQRFGINNPNTEMIKALVDADVDFIFCGQSSVARNFPMEDVQPGIQLALSAMTALIQLQNEGYRLIKF